MYRPHRLSIALSFQRFCFSFRFYRFAGFISGFHTSRNLCTRTGNHFSFSVARDQMLVAWGDRAPLEHSLDLWSRFLFEMTLLPTDIGISKTDLFLHSLTPVILKDASNTIELGCGTVNPMICVLQFPLRPSCTGQILVHFAKNLSSVLWDRCAWWFFSLPYFAKPYQSSKVLYHSTLRQDKFVSSVKSDRFFKLWFKGKH